MMYKAYYDRIKEQTIWIDNKCSTCGKGIENLIDSREWYENEKPNYCPFCGRWINFYNGGEEKNNTKKGKR